MDEDTIAGMMHKAGSSASARPGASPDPPPATVAEAQRPHDPSDPLGPALLV
jgi:hypothetical protein